MAIVVAAVAALGMATFGTGVIGATKGTPQETSVLLPLVLVNGEPANGEAPIVRFECSAAFVTDRFVATAAHCIDPEGQVQSIGAGGNDICTDDWVYQPIAGVHIVRPLLDIAIVELVGPIPEPARVESGQVATVSAHGWQQDERAGPIYCAVHSEVVEPTSCTINPDLGHLCFKPTTLGLCSGSSGGPVIDRGVLLGVVAASTTCTTSAQVEVAPLLCSTTLPRDVQASLSQCK